MRRCSSGKRKIRKTRLFCSVLIVIIHTMKPYRYHSLVEQCCCQCLSFCGCGVKKKSTLNPLDIEYTDFKISYRWVNRFSIYFDFLNVLFTTYVNVEANDIFWKEQFACLLYNNETVGRLFSFWVGHGQPSATTCWPNYGISAFQCSTYNPFHLVLTMSMMK